MVCLERGLPYTTSNYRKQNNFLPYLILLGENMNEKSEESKEWTEEEINRIIDLKDWQGNPIDIFDLHGVLYLGNSPGKEWDITKNYVMFSEHSLPILLQEFQWCETEEEVRETFREVLLRTIEQKLV